MKTQSLEKTKKMVTLALLCALLLVMWLTPLGYLRVAGVFEITFNIIPVAIAAITVGPIGGVVTGAVFGITSFIKMFEDPTIGIPLFNENPVLMIIMLIGMRILVGLLSAYIFKAVKRFNAYVACFVTGLSSALLNTVLYCASFVLFFGYGEYIQSLMEGNGSVFIFLFGAGIFVNATVEAISSTIISGAVGSALIKSGFIKVDTKKKASIEEK